ncbi:hypothetical protein E3N88_00254 [Mikania micrantha]|uniref:Aminotransferase-like plant mobile domain-containing protein n=1 Tax=Mikania micrantha TaxID=192012 RepID=A0A5N6PZM5_9ASTR|nr:hypothetical protein E3N88_00254 [Mikania micrantha]
MSYDVHLGPIVDDLLSLKDSHQARDIFNNRELTKLVFRCADQKFFSLLNSNPITDNVKRYIDIAGFGGVIDSGYRNLDHGLLEALIERWCLETHIFHLPIGEVTVTLEDVNVLWGLPIQGEVVSGCEQLSSLADRIARCHTLLDLTACGQLSWGSAVLAMLYRNLSSNSSNIGGPLYILQLWAWSRMTTLAPTILHRFDNQRPYGAIASAFLYIWDVVEFHTPQRVMRQFGMVQRIPNPIPLSFNEHMKLHSIIRSSMPEKNWRNIHSQFLSVWNNGGRCGTRGSLCSTYCRTKLYAMMDGISQTYRLAGDFMHTESTSNFQNFKMLQNTTNQVMGMLNEESRLHYPSHLQTGPVNLGVDETVPRNLRRREKRRGNVRTGAGTSGVQHQNYQVGTSNVEHENFEAEVYTPQASMLPLFTQPQSDYFNYYAPHFSPNDAYGFSGVSPLPLLDLNLQMSVRDLDDDTFLANTLNAEDVDVDQTPTASRRRNTHRHRRRPGCGT